MSAGSKGTKAELVAIYRLEFYRKQKSWKFSKDARKEAARGKATSPKKVLNQTYDVADPNTDAEALALNEAFIVSTSNLNLAARPDLLEHIAIEDKSETVPLILETVLDPSPVPAPLTPEKIHQAPTVLLEDNRDWPEGGPPPHKWSDLAHYYHEPAVVPEQAGDWLKSKLWLKARHIYQRSAAEEEQLAWQAVGRGELEMTRWVDGSYEGCKMGWPAESQVWTNGQVVAEDVPVELDAADEAEEMQRYQSLLEQWAAQRRPAARGPAGLACHGAPWAAAAPCESACVGVEAEADRSAAEFLLGARAAHHSSELELRAPTARWGPPGACAAPPNDVLSRDPPAPLDGSYEEYPTRDVGLYRPPSAPALVDVLLAGSHMNHPALHVGGRAEVDPPAWGGRGRGRLRGGEQPAPAPPRGRGRLHQLWT